MQIYIASVPVDDVARAHDFYVNTLGFRVKDDVTHGDFPVSYTHLAADDVIDV